MKKKTKLAKGRKEEESFASSNLIIIAITSLYIIACVFIYRFHIDDIFISLRYAQNLAEHGQLSFNLGQAPTEGYSNLLLVLVEALFIKLGVQNGENIPKIAGIISGSLAIWFTFRLSSKIAPTNLKYLPSLALAVSTPFIIWSVGGLETTVFAFLILGGVYFFIDSTENIRSHYYSDLFYFLATLCRPEGILFWGVSYVYLAVKRNMWAKERTKSFTLSFICMLVYLAWKYFYFGDILPLTFYAKYQPMSGGLFIDGIRRFLNFLTINLNFIYFAALIFSIYLAVKEKLSPILYMILLLSAYSFFIISQGNAILMDLWFRFYAPILPLFYLLGAYGLHRLMETFSLSHNFRRIALIILCLLQIGFSAYKLNYYWFYDSGWENMSLQKVVSNVEKLSETGQWLAKSFSPSDTMVVGDVGALGYYSDLPIIDSFSLVSKEIVMLLRAQAKLDPNSEQYQAYSKKIVGYIFDQNPAVIFAQYLPFQIDPRSNNYVAIDAPVSEPLMFVRKDMVPSGTYTKLSDIKTEIYKPNAISF